MKVIIEDERGTRSEVGFATDALDIGRAPDSPVRLAERNISRRHARLVRRDGSVFLEDLGSLTGTRVNGELLRERRQLRASDLIEIGPFELRLQVEAADGFKGPPDVLTPSNGQRLLHTPERLAKAAQPPAPPAAEPHRRSAAAGLAVAALVLLAVAIPAYRFHQRNAQVLTASSNGGDEAAREQELSAAQAALDEHRFTDAVAHFRSAARMGADADQLGPMTRAEFEARDQQRYADLQRAIERKDAEAVRSLWQQLDGSQTYYGKLASQRKAELTAAPAPDPAQAPTAASADPSVKAPPSPAPDAAASTGSSAAPPQEAMKPGQVAAPAPVAPAKPPANESQNPASAQAPPDATAPVDELPIEELARQGDRELNAHDTKAAAASYERALAMRPASRPLLARLYRGLGVAYSRLGDLETSARYYRSYLPLCPDPEERARLSRILQAAGSTSTAAE